MHTLEELSCCVSELKPKTKLDSWLSPLCGFHEIDADKHDALPNVDTESLTFWNSAWPKWIIEKIFVSRFFPHFRLNSS